VEAETVKVMLFPPRECRECRGVIFPLGVVEHDDAARLEPVSTCLEAGDAGAAVDNDQIEGVLGIVTHGGDVVGEVSSWTVVSGRGNAWRR